MPERGFTWAIVLAAGQGSRLASLTTDEYGHSVPKQFCSLRGGHSLLGQALRRAGAVAAPGRVISVVAAEHRELWEPELRGAPPGCVVVQPENRGTAAGILLPLLAIAERDPDARVAIVPSDHHVQDEPVLAGALRLALAHLELEPETLTLLGLRPDAPETSYGWIVPEPGDARVRRVVHFVEKPQAAVAQELFAAGGLWNGFLLTARVPALLALFEQGLPDLLAALRAAFEPPVERRGAALCELYARLPSADFSRDVQEGAEDRLRVVEVPACGWTDLGTPERVAACLREETLETVWMEPAHRAPVVLSRVLRRDPAHRTARVGIA